MERIRQSGTKRPSFSDSPNQDWPNCLPAERASGPGISGSRRSVAYPWSQVTPPMVT